MALDFDGYAIGGVSVGEPEPEMMRAVEMTEPFLPANKPRYAMGLGTPAQLVELVARGVDMFDCVLPTRVARNGTAFTRKGSISIKGGAYKADFRPIEEGCDCFACRNFTRAYLRHLLNVGEILGLRMLSVHNTRMYLRVMEDIAPNYRRRHVRRVPAGVCRQLRAHEKSALGARSGGGALNCVPLVRLWIWVSALASLAGWLLSALGLLNPIGYLVFTAAAFVVLWTTRRDWGWHDTSAWHLSKIRWRLRHLLPLLFAVLAVLVFLGGALYPPTNHTAITYRLPRVLHWLSYDQWHWIHTANYRMNNRACGIEWMSAPLMLFTRSDRALFLLNFIPFLLMPGLLFSIFTRLGISARVAWPWMWLLPTGYNFILQAASTGNDTFPTVYALAAVDFALRARRSGRRSDLFYSLVAAALLTGAKASNLPLLLPWALAVLWAWPKVSLFTLPRTRARALISSLLITGVLLVAAIVSFLPTAVLNVIYVGDWSGLKLERAGMDMKHPLVGIWGNTLIFLLDNFVPPFFPAAAWWNHHALSILPKGIVAPMVANFEDGFHMLWELPTEDWVGIGFGVSVLVAVSVVAGLFVGRNRANQPSSDGWRGLLLLAPWGSLLAFCMKSGMVTGARLISPYYPLLWPLLLAIGDQSKVVRSRWWRTLAAGVMLLAIPVLVVTPGRPLWPAQTILSRLHAARPENRLIDRALKVYSVYDIRSDPLAPVRALLPPDVKVVGFLGTEDDPDYSLWRPFGTRRVEQILPSDSGERLRRHGIHYAVVSGFLLNAEGITVNEWAARVGAELVATSTNTIKVSQGPQPWYVVRIAN